MSRKPCPVLSLLLGAHLSVCPHHDEEVASIRADGLAVEREPDNAKFKHRERSVKTACLLNMSMPKRSAAA